MQLTITIDASPLKRLLGRVSKTQVLTALGLVVLLGASTYAYAINTTPTNTFNAGDAISSSAMNTNFTELYAAASANETDLVAAKASILGLESDTSDLQDDVGAITNLNTCTWRYGFLSGQSGTVTCATTHFAAGGSCSAFVGSIVTSRPVGIAGGTAEAATNATGWFCAKTVTSDFIDGRVLCCPKQP